MSVRHLAAIDLGASSGRVMLATFDPATHQLTLQEIHRFANHLVQIDGSDCWDLDSLHQEIIQGLTKVCQSGVTLHGIGIDTWGVDYVLLDASGQRLGPSYAYRDHRTDGIMAQVLDDLGKHAVYQQTGIQFLPFNTLYQLKAMMNARPAWLPAVTDLVMIPDYLSYRLTGTLNREYTNATTTQLVNIHTDNWDDTLLNYLGVPRAWFGEIRHPGNQTGYWSSASGDKVPVFSVASHDTASAVLATPLTGQGQAYLCSGTWSLMGLDSLSPYTGETSLAYNVTNEGGIDGHYRVLKNIMGLWLFQRVCQEHQIEDILTLIEQAERHPPFRSLINPNSTRFLNPPSMTEAIRLACLENHQPKPQTAAQLARTIFDSLALGYAQVIDELATVQNQPITQLNVVGGGSQNHFLNQLCADVSRINVVAGPVEASTLGNIGCQLMAIGDIDDAAQLREVIRHNFPIEIFTPKATLATDALWRTFRALR